MGLRVAVSPNVIYNANEMENTTKELIEDILEKIKSDEDPVELETYRKYIRKHVPIFLRSYFAAYLFKQVTEKYEGVESTYTELFVNIGKNRRVYPKDIINLFMTKLNIEKTEIGKIKILDNYSFVEISEVLAPKAIAHLSGTDFKGKKLTVNIARKKA